MALRHLVLGCEGEGDAEIDEGLELGIGEVVAVHDIDVRADQTALHQGFPAARCLRLAAALVHRGNQAKITCEGEVVGAHLQRRVVGTEHREA